MKAYIRQVIRSGAIAAALAASLVPARAQDPPPAAAPKDFSEQFDKCVRDFESKGLSGEFIRALCGQENNINNQQNFMAAQPPSVFEFDFRFLDESMFGKDT